jgi:hypothetical protein
LTVLAQKSIRPTLTNSLKTDYDLHSFIKQSYEGLTAYWLYSHQAKIEQLVFFQYKEPGYRDNLSKNTVTLPMGQLTK